MTARTAAAAVGGLPGQLVLDLPGLPNPSPASTRPARRRAPLRVWGVWDGDDLVGVYAEERVARADAAVLRRDAVRAGVRASTVDCLPVPVYREVQHGGRRGRAG